MNPANIPTCPACGGQLVAGSHGSLCPACMLQAAIADDPVADDASPQESRGEQPGARIGRYKLLEKIGEGGFGIVRMAEQEEPVRRRVALKIIKLGMDISPHWVRVSSSPPTFYPRGVRSDWATDQWSGEWVDL